MVYTRRYLGNKNIRTVGFIICGLHITNSPAWKKNLFVIFKSVLMAVLSFSDMSKRENLSCPMDMFLAEAKRGDPVFLFQSHTVVKCPFHGLFSVRLFTFLCFLLVILLFKTVLRHSTEVLSSAQEQLSSV